MEFKNRFKIGASVFWAALLLSSPIYAGWETGAKAGFDSNVDRAISGGESDTFFTGYLSYWKGPSGEARYDWTLSALLEGTAYARFGGLDYGALTISPGLTFFPYLNWTINLSPFIQGKAVSDSDQSALTFGVKLSMQQPLGKGLYLGEYYVYKDSRANVDTYSFTENALGIFLGKNWTRTLFSEIGYEFAHGDSFRSIGTSNTTVTTSTPGKGRGNQFRHSSAFETDVAREKVDRHSIGFTAGMDLTQSVFSQIAYTYTLLKGDLGTSIDHQVFIGLGYRF